MKKRKTNEPKRIKYKLVAEKIEEGGSVENIRFSHGIEDFAVSWQLTFERRRRRRRRRRPFRTRDSILPGRKFRL
jgi:hypothetical protein